MSSTMPTVGGFSAGYLAIAVAACTAAAFAVALVPAGKPAAGGVHGHGH